MKINLNAINELPLKSLCVLELTFFFINNFFERISSASVKLQPRNWRARMRRSFPTFVESWNWHNSVCLGSSQYKEVIALSERSQQRESSIDFMQMKCNFLIHRWKKRNESDFCKWKIVDLSDITIKASLVHGTGVANKENKFDYHRVWWRHNALTQRNRLEAARIWRKRNFQLRVQIDQFVSPGRGEESQSIIFVFALRWLNDQQIILHWWKRHTVTCVAMQKHLNSCPTVFDQWDNFSGISIASCVCC